MLCVCETAVVPADADMRGYRRKQPSLTLTTPNIMYYSRGCREGWIKG